jgi:biotin-dependent carboxylase-like uncharacterized protein
MTPALHVLAPGLLTTVQDLGRAGYQRLGIAVGGALDPVSLRAANALAGNPPGAGALEIAYTGPTLAIEADDVRLAFVGAPASIEILEDASASSGRQVDTMRSVLLRRGEVVRIGSLSSGAVLYVAVEGGFDIAPMLGSVSTYIRGGFGGWHGRALIAGDRLLLRRMQASEREELRLEGLDLSVQSRLRVILGPQCEQFSTNGIETLLASEYTVSAESDRVGMRLAGPPIEHARNADMVSDGIAPGSIQVPANGQPIVLQVDRQTTGGYPKIATVISADLPALGRLPIGAKVSFERVTLEVAQALRRKLAAEIEGIYNHLVPLSLDEPDFMLLDANLISGVVSARSWNP